ncbi:helicase-related protein [Pararhizobium mangrovi]|uniref:Helicase n=1 Tax=Pararhizobium mangrovi TaxID=2590452 RepID=A0A506UD61_9HYPH|nr:helicase-related protein [Pararhizobium mangrovi]TPW30735.1 helicase [Pararhizobium mangrovi]
MLHSAPAPGDPLILSGRDVTAVLGPTNTGKTHYAIERMIAHRSGVIGLPLRLLAREVYQRVAERVGADQVSLVTGEEKITPAGARFSVCTVEAMPRETSAAFVAIDEVQIAADLERGHIFTDRLLHLRGRDETLLLGSDTMRRILEQLLPGITVVSRPRLSQLLWAGSRKISRLPRRTAIVAFSADEVYAIAELIRRQRGGAAVVMGALSPRTRNAQVALYQSGDVEYLVATDAIGMGLNLDVDHVAFAQTRKFDGYQFRPLNPAELGQIAGRAGRHVNDGTFGVTGRTEPIGDDVVQRIEAHEFNPVKVLQWRSKGLDFANLDALRASLDATPAVAGLTRALPAVDQQALEHLARFPEIAERASSPARLEKLWEACALPDYRRITPAQHAELIGTIFTDLVDNKTVSEDFLAEQVHRADRTEGDIETLSGRIAQIRTWTYVSHRPGWLADPAHWQEKTREIEDRLSDALHERLTKRFVDRRTSVLMKRLRENAMLEAEISGGGAVEVEGHAVGHLSGFRFVPDQNADGPDAKAVLAAAQKALANEYEARAARLHASGNNDFALGSDATVRWMGEPVGRLAASESVLRPRVILLADEPLQGAARDLVAARVERYVNHTIATLLKPLDQLSQADDLTGLARGVAFQLVEALGVLFRRDVSEEIRSLDQEARASLRRYGVRFGAYHVFVPTLLKPAPAELITLLWALKNDAMEKPGYGDVIATLAAGRTSVVTDLQVTRDFYRLAGFRFLGKRAVRIDILERLSDLIRPALQWKPGQNRRPEGGYDGRRFVTTPAMLSILGATPDDMEEILKGLGYRAEPVPAETAKAHLAEMDIEAAPPSPEVNATGEPETTDEPVQAAGSQDAAAPTEPAASEATTSDAAAGEEPAEAAQASEADAGTVSQEAAPATGVEDAPADPAEAVAVSATTAPLENGEIDREQASGETVLQSAGAKAAETPSPDAASVEVGASQNDASDPDGSASDTSDTGTAEEKPVLLWRPLGRNEQQRGRPRRREAGGREAGNREAGNREAGHQDPGNREAGGRENERHNRGAGKPRGGKGKPGKGEGRQGGKPKHAGAPGGKGRGQPSPQRDRPIDPDSPFAKLAALKEQLKK